MDNSLVTSRKPDDLSAFVKALLEELADARAARLVSPSPGGQVPFPLGRP